MSEKFSKLPQKDVVYVILKHIFEGQLHILLFPLLDEDEGKAEFTSLDTRLTSLIPGEMYGIVSGGVEAQETSEQAALNELDQERKLKLEPWRLSNSLATGKMLQVRGGKFGKPTRLNVVAGYEVMLTDKEVENLLKQGGVRLPVSDLKLELQKLHVRSSTRWALERNKLSN